jgi:hypothetical protein
MSPAHRDQSAMQSKDLLMCTIDAVVTAVSASTAGDQQAGESSNSEAAMSDRLQQLAPSAFLALLRAVQNVTAAAARRVALVAGVVEDILRNAKAHTQ